MIWGQVPSLDLEQQPSSPLEFRDYESIVELRSVGAWRPYYVNVTGEREPERLLAARASSRLFSTLGVSPLRGRGFGVEDDQPGRGAVTVLSNAYWRRRFGADPAILGRTVQLNGMPHEIIGVMPEGFKIALGPRSYDLWTPLGPDLSPPPRRDFRRLSVVARIAPDVSFSEAGWPWMPWPCGSLGSTRTSTRPGGSSISSWSRCTIRWWGTRAGPLTLVSALVAPRSPHRVCQRRQPPAGSGDGPPPRGGALRRFGREPHRHRAAPALRGADPRVGRGSGGRAAGRTSRFGPWCASTPDAMPRLGEVAVDGTVLLFALAVSIASGLAAALVPALEASKPDLGVTLKEADETRAVAGAGGRVRSALVVAEIAVAMIVLVAAGLMIRSFLSLKDVEPGFDSEGVLSFHLYLSPQKYPERHLYDQLYQRLLSRLGQVPGVTRVAAVNDLPLGSRQFAVEASFDGYESGPGEPKPLVDWRPASPGYFSTLGIPLLSGRDFESFDDAESQPVAIVDRRLAERFWPGQEAVGRRLKLVGRPGNVAQWRTVVGVVGDVKAQGLEAAAREHVYTPYAQASFPFFAVALKTNGDPRRIVPEVQKAVWELDAEQPIFGMAPLTELLESSFAGRRSFTWLMGLFAAVALVLVTLGVYGVMATMVAQRAAEIGIRLALGAERKGVLSMVVARSLTLAGVGLVLGTVGTAALILVLRRSAEGLLFSVDAFDPLTLLSAILLIVTLALVAAFVPARRALAVEPASALRR